MTAWPQIERCSRAQWRSYPPEVRDLMTAEWKVRSGSPGIVGNAGHHLFPIWRVDRPGSSSSSLQDILIAIKVDLGPSLLDSKNIHAVASDE